MKKVYITILFILIAVFSAGCGSEPVVSKTLSSNEKINVVTTFYPLYEFAGQVGGDRVEVYNLLPPGAEPHGWEPTPRDLARVENSDLFIYNGAGLEPWVEQRLLPGLKNKGVCVVNASSGLDLISQEEMEEHNHKYGHSHGESGYDPHFWLDPVMAKQIVENICTALINLDPADEQYYRENTAGYSDKLTALDREFSEAVEDFKSKDLVTSHSAFAYLARRYGLKQVSVLGLSPEARPSPARLKEVVDLVRSREVRCIFFEPMVSSRLSETVAREVGVKTAVLDPVSGLTDEQIARGDNYIKLMHRNLAVLKENLS